MSIKESVKYHKPAQLESNLFYLTHQVDILVRL